MDRKELCPNEEERYFQILATEDLEINVDKKHEKVPSQLISVKKKAIEVHNKITNINRCAFAVVHFVAVALCKKSRSKINAN